MRDGALVLLALLCGAPDVVRAETSCAVEGRVLDRAAGTPVEEAIVTLLPGTTTALTDSSGRFCVPSVDPGRYAVLVRRLGYLTPEPIPLDLTGDAQPAPLEVTLVRSGMVEEVVVKPPEPAKPGTVETPPRQMPREEITSLPGTLDDPVRALTALPGVSGISDYKAEIRLDGGEPSDTLFMIDGVLVDNPYHFRWLRGSAAAFGASAFDHLEVHTTGLGAEIGDTISGIVRLDPSERGATGTSFDGSFGTLMSSFTSVGALPSNGSWVASMRYSNLALYRDLYGVDNFDVPDLGDMVFRFKSPIADGVDVLGGVLALTNQLHTSDPKDGAWDEVNAGASMAWTGLDAVLGPNSRLMARASFSSSRQKFDTSDGDNLTADENRTWFQVRAEGVAAEKVHVSGGVEGGTERGAIAGQLQTIQDLAPLDVVSTRVAGFASVRVAPAPGWSVESGLRTDRDSHLGAAPIQGRLRAEYAPGSGWAWHFGAGRYAQFPRFDEQFLAQGETLLPAVSDEIEAGAAIPLSQATAVDVTAFARRMSDLTAEVVNKNPDMPEPMGQFQSGRSRGLEFSVRHDGETLSSRLSLTLLDAQETRLGVTSPRNGDQPWFLGLTSAWNASEHWSLLGRVQAGAGLPYSPMLPAGGGLRLLGPLNSARLPSYQRLDIRSMWSTTWRTAKVSAYVEIANVLGAPNVRSEDLLWDDARQVYETHQEQGMPRLPGFGITISWAPPATVRASRKPAVSPIDGGEAAAAGAGATQTAAAQPPPYH
jgi:hypothetical protein